MDSATTKANKAALTAALYGGSAITIHSHTAEVALDALDKAAREAFIDRTLKGLPPKPDGFTQAQRELADALLPEGCRDGFGFGCWANPNIAARDAATELARDLLAYRLQRAATHTGGRRQAVLDVIRAVYGLSYLPPETCRVLVLEVLLQEGLDADGAPFLQPSGDNGAQKASQGF